MLQCCFLQLAFLGKFLPSISSSTEGRQLYSGPGVVVGVMRLKLAVFSLGLGQGYPFKANTKLSQHSILLTLIRTRAHRNTHSLYEKKKPNQKCEVIFTGKGKHRIQQASRVFPNPSLYWILYTVIKTSNQTPPSSSATGHNPTPELSCLPIFAKDFLHGHTQF